MPSKKRPEDNTPEDEGPAGDISTGGLPSDEEARAGPPARKSPRAKTVQSEDVERILSGPAPRQRDEQIFSRTDLKDLTREELVEIILRIQSMIPKSHTEPIGMGNIAAVVLKAGSGVGDFVRVPNRPGSPPQEEDGPIWRVKLQCTDTRYRPLNLEIVGDILVGRMTRESTPDLDLTLYGGTTLGVSRKQAMLRPTEKELRLVDLDSTNGTYRNGERIPAGEPVALKDGDLLSFGELRFRLKILEPPSETGPAA